MNKLRMLCMLFCSAFNQILIFAVCTFSGTAVAIVDNTESIFEEAVNYTVKIHTVVETPFGEDDFGAFSGAGFLVDAKRRWVLTNAHVVGRAPSIVQASFKGGERYPIKKIFVDPYFDIAIIELPDGSLPKTAKAAQLDCSKRPAMGHMVGAFGHPEGLNYTGTRGIVSGVTYFSEEEWLQTDAPINHGNSGGPLISLSSGRIVGINTAIIDKKKTEGLNFATPIIFACKIVNLLKAGKDASPPKLPLFFYKNLSEDQQGLVVAENLAADRLSFQTGDEILQINDSPEPPTNELHLVHALRGHLVNSQIKIKRQNKEMTLSVTWLPALNLMHRQGIYISGMVLATPTYRDIKDTTSSGGLMIHSVNPQSFGQSLGFETFDIVRSVDDRVFQDVDGLFRYLTSERKSDRPIKVSIKRMSYVVGHMFEYHFFEIPIEYLEVKPLMFGE